MRTRITLASVALVAALFPLFASIAFAAPPSTAALEGVLTSTGGGPAADGNYDLTARLYAAKSGGNALWTEATKGVPVKSGGFSLLLGATTAITAAALDVDGGPWLSVQVGADPELPRTQVHTVLFALRAATAATAKTADSAKTARRQRSQRRPRLPQTAPKSPST